MGISKKSFISLFLSFCLVFSLISVLLVKPVDAKTVRVAIIAALSGDVTIKKGGGSKSYDAYENMSLNQGDTVYTGAGSSATLNLSNGDADVTLSENAEINVSDLNTSDGNKKSKLKVWAGSMWVKVKSLAGSDDEFEVETPTAVMGVRGTQFFVMVDPKTGAIKMAVGAGKVSATTVKNEADSTQTTTITYLYPTQQISLDSRDETEELSLKVDFIDLDGFIKDASQEVIKEIIRNKAEIDKENDAFIAKKKKEIEDGKLVNDQTSLTVRDQIELDKVQQNFDNLIGNIAKKALIGNKIDKASMDKVIDEANKKIAEQNRKLDLDKVKELDRTAGVDAENEKLKRELLQKLEAEKLKKKIEEEKKQEELQKKLAASLKALEEHKKKILEATKAAEEKAKVEAEAKLKESLSDEEKKKFDDEKNGTKTTAPESGSGSESDISEPVLPTPSPSPSPTPSPSLTVAGTTISEAAANDGSFTAKQVVTLANGTFVADMSTGVTVNSLPAGLSTSVIRNTDKQITITFTGNAAAHAAANDVTNATVTIAKAKIVEAAGDVTSNAFKFEFSNPVPKVSLFAAPVPNNFNGEFTLDINLSDFAWANSIYGVEVHLLYGENTSYNTNSPPLNKNIFSSANSADYIREYRSSGQQELVYAVTNFGNIVNNENTDEFGNVIVMGPKKLVTIPLKGYGDHTISVGKIVIVRKNGSNVQNLEIPVTSISPANITIEVPEV